MSDRETKKYLGNGQGQLHRTFLGIEMVQESSIELEPEYKPLRYRKGLGVESCECGRRFLERSLVIRKKDGTLLCPECYQSREKYVQKRRR